MKFIFLFMINVIFVTRSYATVEEYLMLKTRFENAGPAVLDDFLDYSPNTDNCFAVMSKGERFQTSVLKITKITPPAGPLLPEVREKKIVAGIQPRLGEDKLVEILFDQLQNTWSTNELVVTVPGDLIDVQSPVITRVRKSNYLYFNSEIKNNLSSYGYCP